MKKTRSWKIAGLTLFLFAYGWCDTGFVYRPASGEFSVRFPQRPSKVYTHASVDYTVGDSSGCMISVYDLPNEGTDTYWQKLFRAGESKYTQAWITVNGQKALKRTRNAGDQKVLFEQVYIIAGSRVYQLTAHLEGPERTALKKKAREFWSTFTVVAQLPIPRDDRKEPVNSGRRGVPSLPLGESTGN